MKKKIIFQLLFLLAAVKLNAQNWIIAKHAGGATPYGDGATKIAVDDVGNVFIVGGYTGTAYFDNDTVDGLNNAEFALAKYNSNGNLIWVRHAGGYSPGLFNGGSSLKVDRNGNCYVTGTFCGTAAFDTTQLTSYGDQDIFIAKYDSSGNCLWAKKAGGIDGDISKGIALDETDNIYIIGQFSSLVAYFDSATINSSTNSQLFIAKYNNDGNCLWVQTTSGTGGSNGYGISSYNDKIYIAAFADSTCTFGTIPADANASFIVQYDTSGTCNWIKPIIRGGGAALSNDNAGNLYITGNYQDSAVFDTIAVYQSNTYFDFFIAKYNDTGNIYWIKTTQSSIASLGNDIVTDSAGNSYVTGYFHGNVHFGNSILTAAGQQSIFVSKYDASGSCLGAVSAGITSINTHGITIDASNACYIAGQFSDSVTFDATTLHSYGAGDIFWAKLDGITDVQENERNGNNQLLIYANPNQGKCNITVPQEFQNEKNLTLTVYDNTGKVIQQTPVQMNEDKIKLSIQAQAKGIYNVTLSNGKKSYGGKIVFE